jgi:hypothetical protein
MPHHKALSTAVNQENRRQVEAVQRGAPPRSNPKQLRQAGDHQSVAQIDDPAAEHGLHADGLCSDPVEVGGAERWVAFFAFHFSIPPTASLLVKQPPPGRFLGKRVSRKKGKAKLTPELVYIQWGYRCLT